MKPNRHVIAIDNGIFLCNDGTMWRNFLEYDAELMDEVIKWIQLDNVPQPECVKVSISIDERIKQSDRIALHAYTDNCCTE